MTATPASSGSTDSDFQLGAIHIRWLSLTVLVAMMAYLGFALWSGWAQVRHALVNVGWSGTVIALLLSLVNYSLRFVRWQGYLHRMGHQIACWPSLHIYLAGFALTTTPGKAGEALRGVLLKPQGVPYTDSFAAFFSERLSDLLAVVVLALFGLSLYPPLQPVLAVGTIGVVVGLVMLGQKRLVGWLLRATESRPQRKLYRSLNAIAHMLGQAQRCHGWQQLLGASVLSLIAWFAEALAFYWVLGWMGASVSLQLAVFIYAAAMLAGALSFMPGGLGGAEAVMVALLMWAGMPVPDAVAATVLIRMTTLWFAVLLGLGCLWCQNRTCRATRQSI